MSDEAKLQISLQITNGALQVQTRPTSFQMDIEEEGGPTPGTITVPTTGVDVDLTELINPGLCWMQNLDDENYVEYGVHDGSIFHPVGELPPASSVGGKPFVIYLSRNLGEEHDVAGTGTTGTVNSFHMKAIGATCLVRVEAYER